ncbi:MAG: ribbon-helix-helix domain-containing protein [Alphaproteobacteria bacterium]
MNNSETVTIRRRSVTIAGHRTSVSIEDVFWDVLKRIASDRNVSLNRLVGEIDKNRAGNLSSALRVHVVHHLLGRPEADSGSSSGRDAAA